MKKLFFYIKFDKVVNSGLGLLLILLSVLCCLSACKEENLRRNINKSDAIPPQVTDVKVDPLPGAAKISYTLPKNSLDLLYVKASYEIRPGVKEEAVTSFYGDTILVQGFADATPRKIKLVSVNRSGNESEPVNVKVSPLQPPVQQVFDSLDYIPDFGGIHVITKNPSGAKLMFGIIIKDSLGEWVDYDREYSGLSNIDFSVRGLPAVNTDFGVYVRDRWHNFSDTLFKTLVPLFEEELDKNYFSFLGLPGDDQSNTWDISGLWDEDPGGHDGIHTNDGLPVHCQFAVVKAGHKAKISRFRLWQIFDGREYSSSNVKKFEIWGSNNYASDGSFDGWTLMGTFEIQKPSGLPSGQLSEEDRAAAAAGDEFTMPFSAPAVRYIRINILSTYASPPNSISGTVWLTQVSFWGQVE